MPAIYTILACWTRFYQIGKANIVVWDEAHFGKFGSHYLKREFYFDVHPPLGKMIVAFAGALAGYDGSFDFKSGADYPDEVPYVAMRVILALFGVGMVPVAWYTAVELGLSWRGCHLLTLMVLFGEQKALTFIVVHLILQMWHGCASLVSFFWILCYYSSRSLLYSLWLSFIMNNTSARSSLFP